jgi:hypothetical protein
MTLPPDLRSADLRALALELVQLDVLAAESLGLRLVNLLAQRLETDRVSLSLVDLRAGMTVLACGTGGNGSIVQDATVGKLIAKALAGEGPLIFRNIREHADLAGLWADDYRTNACAVLPLHYVKQAIGALCISNLTEAQALGLQVQKHDLALFLHLTTQLAIIYATEMGRRGDERLALWLSRLAGAA